MNRLYRSIIDRLNEKVKIDLQSHFEITGEMSEKIYIIPPARTRYLSEISETVRKYAQWTIDQGSVAQKLFGIRKSIDALKESKFEDKDRMIKQLEEFYLQVALDLDGKTERSLKTGREKYRNTEMNFTFTRFVKKTLK